MLVVDHLVDVVAFAVGVTVYVNDAVGVPAIPVAVIVKISVAAVTAQLTVKYFSPVDTMALAGHVVPPEVVAYRRLS